MSQINTEISPTSPKKLAGLIKSIHLKKAPGLDQITNTKNSSKNNLCCLTSDSIQCLPKVRIFSRNMEFRPINLLSTMAKLFEKIIDIKLTEEIENQNIIPTFQFGFRKRHSTCHQLQRLTETTEDSFQRK